ncbi:hypothetical protein PGT21_005984 [Puccinia graminis f. sp. tritici]|uniref:Uncharacterized protein n=1 Tax=Puccinia graminis f. sp. tritici TaxID=56615 RepID=A0A5B0P7A2_PUCGR|nr:hypothetical protein PGT21_005984 [Puccinia graminis f. sp. tritici]
MVRSLTACLYQHIHFQGHPPATSASDHPQEERSYTLIDWVCPSQKTKNLNQLRDLFQSIFLSISQAPVGTTKPMFKNSSIFIVAIPFSRCSLTKIQGETLVRQLSEISYTSTPAASTFLSLSLSLPRASALQLGSQELPSKDVIWSMKTQQQLPRISNACLLDSSIPSIPGISDVHSLLRLLRS